MRLRALIVAALLAGCGPRTGFLFDVQSPPGVQVEVASLELRLAHRSMCDRWVEDVDARTVADVSARDLVKSPFQWLVRPVHLTNLDDPVHAMVLARDRNQRLVGTADFGAHPYRLHQYLEYTSTLDLLPRAMETPAPQYVAADGNCACVPGQPWLGTGDGSACDRRVVTSFDRFNDRVGCELAPDAAQLKGPVCDGQIYPDEVSGRVLPCFASSGGACRVGGRVCHDDDGQAYDTECVPDAAGPMLADDVVCAGYRECEQQACGDLIGCLKSKLTMVRRLNCVLLVDATKAGNLPPASCGGGPWQQVIAQGATAGACVATVLDGTRRGDFTIGFLEGTSTTLQSIAGACPVTLGVDAGGTLDTIPATLDADLTLGDALVRTHVQVVKGCTAGVATFTCHFGP